MQVQKRNISFSSLHHSMNNNVKLLLPNRAVGPHVPKILAHYQTTRHSTTLHITDESGLYVMKPSSTWT